MAAVDRLRRLAEVTRGRPPQQFAAAWDAMVDLLRELAQESTGGPTAPVHHYARAGPSGIAGATVDVDTGHVIPAEGDATLLVDRGYGPLAEGGPIKLRNAWLGSIDAGWEPILIVRIDGRWSVAQLECTVPPP